MKKLLLVLMVVALASFLFVGCLPVTPNEGEGEGEGEAEICPTVSITSQAEVGGKTYIKAGSQTITVTFAVPTEPVSVFVGPNIKGNPDGVPDLAAEVVMYPDADKKVYTGTYTFTGECDEDYIYVVTCATCAPCKYPYIVDSVGPTAKIEVDIDDCVCAGCELIFESFITETDCDPDVVECDDACSGFASWSIDIYEDDPFDECCLIPCEEPIASDSDVCPVDFTTACLTEDFVYVVVTLVDEVGNETKYFATVESDPDTCSAVIVKQYTANGEDGECTLWTAVVDTADIVAK